MKWNLTIRRGILLLLALFGLIIGGTIYLTVRYARQSFVVGEYQDVLDELIILGRQIDVELSKNSENPYGILETAAAVQSVEENFSYLVRDSSGIILAPAFAAGKELPMKHKRNLIPDGRACLAEVWGYTCFVVFYPIPNRSLEMLAVYDNKYVFEEIFHTVLLYVIILIAVYLVLVLLSWFWIIPELERTLARKQRVEGELNAAQGLQQKAVTTEFPPNPFFETYAVLQPAREVGGDIYRCGFQDGKFYFLIGDVSDKGVAAGLLMFTLSSYVHSRTRGDVDICELMKELNCLVCDNPQYEMLCTLFLGVIDPETLEMEYCNAGHTRTLVSGEYLEQDPQLLAGIDREYEYHSQKVQLKHGDRVLLYTDGVTEARGADRSFYGEGRLQEWMKGLDPSVSSEEGCRSLLDTLSVFRGKAQQNDDIAIIYIKVI